MRDQFLERVRIGGRVFEPGQEVEGLAEIAAVIELPGDRRQIFQARRNVVRSVLKNLPPLLLRQLPPRRRFLDRDQRGMGRLGAAELGLHGIQPFLFGALGIAQVAGDAGQPPGGRRGQDRQRDRQRMHDRQRRRRRQRRALDRRAPRHPPRPALAASENREHGGHGSAEPGWVQALSVIRSGAQSTLRE